MLFKYIGGIGVRAPSLILYKHIYQLPNIKNEASKKNNKILPLLQ